MEDGELFLEYIQSEGLAFDDGRIKSASFDQSQGFGLRALSGEATGYAHASELSDAAIERAGKTVSAVREGSGGTLALPRRRAPTARSIPTTTRWPRSNSRRRPRCWARSTPMPAPRTLASGRSGLDLGPVAGGADRARRRQPAGDIRPLVRLNVSIVVERGRPHGDRHLRRRRPRACMTHYLDPATWKAQVDEALRQALVNLARSRRRPAK